jgi:hypothetical protein
MAFSLKHSAYDLTFFNGEKISLIMGSDQIANLPPVNFDGCIEDVESRQSACYSMTGVKLSKLEVIEVVKQVTI